MKKNRRNQPYHLACPYRVRPGSKVKLAALPTDDDGGLTQMEGETTFNKLSHRLVEAQEMLYSDARFGLLVVLQAMDGAGKDSTIRHVFGPINPQGCHVSSFKAPVGAELTHDYLWRIHQQVPARGYIGIFNRSHYEDIVTVRVRNLAAKDIWKKRYDHVNDFERMLCDEGIVVVKFFLHVSKDYQKQRLQRRLDQPDKHWKLEPGDLETRKQWDQYMKGFSEVIERCSTEHAPWYIIPAEQRWYRNMVISQILLSRLDALGLQYPKPRFDPKSFVLK